MAEKIERIIMNGSTVLSAEDVARLNMLSIPNATRPVDVDGKIFFETKLPGISHMADTQISFGGSASEALPGQQVGERPQGVDISLWKK